MLATSLGTARSLKNPATTNLEHSPLLIENDAVFATFVAGVLSWLLRWSTAGSLKSPATTSLEDSAAVGETVPVISKFVADVRAAARRVLRSVTTAIQTHYAQRRWPPASFEISFAHATRWSPRTLPSANSSSWHRAK